MTRHVVIGTAGHVDHGKSSLVLVLTGTDPDRWAEEKRRGITIDLGFALLPLSETQAASIVDVPGHEDFVRNMVAGATGIDIALLVVAADEGVMPQTVEHLAILDYLGITTGVVAITKADLVEPDWITLVADDLRDRLANHSTTWTATVPVSATTGTGLDTLRDALRAAAAHQPGRSADDLFRMPVDRVFAIAGAGTVVTGTVWSGTVRTGDTARFLPGDTQARVRSIEVHGTQAESALPGRRTALALAGADRADLSRGVMAVTDSRWRASSLLDVTVRMLPGTKPLTQRSRLRVHLGTAEALARVTLGQDGTVRLRLESPLVARWGDRGVLRSYSPVTTIGGFVVIDPWPAPRPRRPTNLLAGPDRLRHAAAAAGPSGIPIADLPIRLRLPETAGQGTVQVGDRVVLTEHVTAARDGVIQALTKHHAAHPEAPGLGRDTLRDAVGPLTDHAVSLLVTEKKIQDDGATLRMAGHAPALATHDTTAADALRAALDTAGFEGLDRTEVDVRLAEFLVREGVARRVGRDRYYLVTHLTAMLEIARQVLSKGEASPADFRDQLGISRKYLMPFLEWLDQEGYSVRSDGGRRAGHRLAAN